MNDPDDCPNCPQGTCCGEDSSNHIWTKMVQEIHKRPAIWTEMPSKTCSNNWNELAELLNQTSKYKVCLLTVHT